MEKELDERAAFLVALATVQNMLSGEFRAANVVDAKLYLDGILNGLEGEIDASKKRLLKRGENKEGAAPAVAVTPSKRTTKAKR